MEQAECATRLCNNPVSQSKDNIVSQKLTPNVSKLRLIACQQSTITNGQPIPFWDFAKALWHEYNGYADQPTAVPVFLGQWLAGLGESICWMLGKPEPTMNTKRIANAVTPRYFNIEKARRLLESEPQVSLDEGISVSHSPAGICRTTQRLSTIKLCV